MYSCLMTNIFKESVYIPPSITVICIGWKLKIQTETDNFLFVFPRYTKLVYSEYYLEIGIQQVPSIIYGGFLRTLKSLIKGLIIPYVRKLYLTGREYSVKRIDDKLILRLGHSHEIIVNICSILNVTIIKRSHIIISGYSLEKVTQLASKVKSYRKPDPFKGKGVICIGETIRRKETKKKPY